MAQPSSTIHSSKNVYKTNAFYPAGSRGLAPLSPLLSPHHTGQHSITSPATLVDPMAGLKPEAPMAGRGRNGTALESAEMEVLGGQTVLGAQ